MTDSTLISSTPPTRLLRLAATAASWCLGLVVAAWLVLALAWGGLHGWIVPRIGEFRPWVEVQASKALGNPVRIGAISATSTHWIPTFELRDVALLDAQGHPALRLPHVVATLSPRALLRRGFEQLVVEQPELDILRSADGKIFIAGLDFSHTNSSDGKALDWLFAQAELVVRGGTVRWTDAQRAAPPLALSGVDFVMRNQGLGHSLRLDASPPADWGDRFSLVAQLRQPLLGTRRGQWQNWDGPVYASLPRVDVSQLRQYADVADVGFDVAQGVGALRLWADIRHGQVTGGTADVALADARVTLAPGLLPLALQSLHGRLTGKQQAGSTELATEGLQFTTAEGLVWPGGNVALRTQDASAKAPAQGQLRADRLDLAVLARMAASLPLGPATAAVLETYAPQGQVAQIDSQWQGPLEAPVRWSAKGRATGLQVAAGAPEAATAARRFPLGRPGVRGMALDFDMTQAGGKAEVRMAQGALDLPGVFEEPVVPITSLSASVAWQLQGDRLAVQASDVKFANADAEGSLQVKWQHSDPARSSSHARIPGVLDLQGQLSRGHAARVHRYLPLELDAEVRHYVRDAVRAGALSKVKFRVKGDLYDFPFHAPVKNAAQGEFRLSAEVRDASYAFVPPSLRPAEALQWPALEQLSGELVIDKASLQINRATARMGANFQITQAEAAIADLHRSVVVFKGQGRGPVTDMLATVARSPLASATDHALDHASGSGVADLRLRLQLPIDNIDKSKVQGSLTLAGNDLQLGPDHPLLGKAQGVVNFTESGFTVAGAQARLLGGDAKIDGGMATGAGMQFRVQGVASAEGLRQASMLGVVSRVAAHASGNAAYSAVLAGRQDVTDVQVSSNLKGLALNLPAPLAKAADAVLPLRFTQALLPGTGGSQRDSLALELGALASVAYLRDISGSEPRVLRGTLAVGLPPGESLAMPAEGVAAKLHVDSVNADAWEAVLAKISGPAGPALSASNGYAPTTLAVQAKALTLGGRTLHQLVLGASHFATTWRANLDAQELNGYVEYRQPQNTSPGRVYARLTRLALAPSNATEVESLLDAAPDTVPALDIVVDALELKGKKLGRVEVDAVNRGGGGSAGAEAGVREWRLNKLSISNPDMQLSATGNWMALRSAPRRTALNFQLDIADAGQLLTRLGMPGVVRRGKGQMAGQISWVGSPLALDTPTLGGQFHLAIESGQFLKADPGLTKLLGVLNLQALPRRLALDFRDLFSDGFAFDAVRGDVRVAQGTAFTNNLQMKGVNAAVMMEGHADIGRETQDLRVLVVPEINAGTASLVAAAINPVVGLGTFLAQWFLSRPLSEAATQQFHIDGTWADPKITKVPRKILDAKAPIPQGANP